MKFRSLLVLISFALSLTVACGGGDQKADEAPTEEPTSAPMEETPVEEAAPVEEATPEEAAPETEAAPEGDAAPE